MGWSATAGQLAKLAHAALCRHQQTHSSVSPAPPPPPLCPQLFFRCHIICFLGFFLFACAHYVNCYTYFVPGELTTCYTP